MVWRKVAVYDPSVRAKSRASMYERSKILASLVEHSYGEFCGIRLSLSVMMYPSVATKGNLEKNRGLGGAHILPGKVQKTFLMEAN